MRSTAVVQTLTNREIRRLEQNYEQALTAIQTAKRAEKSANERGERARGLDIGGVVARKAEELAEAKRQLTAHGLAIPLDEDAQIQQVIDRSPVLKLRAESRDFRDADDLVAQLERKRYLLLTQIEPLRNELDKATKNPQWQVLNSSLSESAQQAQAVRRALFPEVQAHQVKVDAARLAAHNEIAEIQQTLAPLESQFEKACAELEIATKRRDEMLAQHR